MPLGKLDRIDARLKRYAAKGLTRADLAAARKKTKAARRKELAPLQKEINAVHAAWVAAGMPSK